MAFILSLETSTSVCSVALHEDDRLLGLSEIHIEQSHASKLALLVGQVISIAGLEMNQLNAVAISEGPGSYTGLRIGASTAKGLCYALNIPLIAVSPLEVMANQVQNTNVSAAYLCPMIDARRMEVFCLVVDENLSLRKPVSSLVIEENSFEELLSQKTVLFFGNGADKCESVIKHPNALFIKGIYPSASQLGVYAYTKYQTKKFEDLIHFEPFYLKEFYTKKAVGTQN
jgi:tRNA threonylcarbamoyladenosine biosynthesis protein TsaB